jgi:ABC-type Mn2+/Zn2+ transport system ATPase subunit
LGPIRESYPLILDDPFRDVDPSVKPALLALLSRWAGNPQVIFLTEDPDVVDWARVEQITSEISLIEAAPTSSLAPPTTVTAPQTAPALVLD